MAKAANLIAKKNAYYKGILSLIASEQEINRQLEKIRSEDVWGIGRKLSQWLYRQNVNTALELKNFPIPALRKKAGVGGARIIEELRGTSCFEIAPPERSKKSIAVTRSFKGPVTSENELKKIIATFVESACEKLREDNLYCKEIIIFLKTNRFKKEEYYSNSALSRIRGLYKYNPLIRLEV